MLDDQTGTGVPEICTETSYADNTTAWIRDVGQRGHHRYPGVPGHRRHPLTAADITKDTRTYYDGSTSLTAAPTAGNPTMTTEATANNAGTLTFVTQNTQTYDSSGRVITSTDARGNTTTTAYTPADGGPTTQTATTNALGQTATEVLRPRPGLDPVGDRRRPATSPRPPTTRSGG